MDIVVAGGTVGKSTSSSRTVLTTKILLNFDTTNLDESQSGWTTLAPLPRSLYGPRASLVEDKMRVAGGDEVDDRGRGDYRNEVNTLTFSFKVGFVFTILGKSRNTSTAEAIFASTV